ncbi:MAG: glycine zipper 2TM domain-containing protein [Candidatus Zixiibacteriota bacterium]|nr:MAG: glycine zipper 2TM domain-containing protein [candidate division Zixibacteria bacterium]
MIRALLSGLRESPVYLFGAVVMSCLLLGSLPGCSSGEKTGETEMTEEQAVLPEDGDTHLLDTTIAEPEEVKVSPEEEVSQKPEKPKPAPKPEPKPEPKPQPKEPEYVETMILPENKALEVELLTAKISTETNQPGDRFRVMVLGPMEKGEPSTLPEGTIIEGEIAALDNGKAEGASASILLKFTDFILPGEKAIPIEGYVVTKDGDGLIKAGSKTGTVAKDAGIGAIAGGVLGAITGKKKTKDAAKGAVIGAAAGGVLGAVLHKDRVELKAGNKMDIAIIGSVIQKKLKK